jgi:hypothetical protein
MIVERLKILAKDEDLSEAPSPRSRQAFKSVVQRRCANELRRAPLAAGGYA